MNVKPPDRVLRKPVCTWVSRTDYERFHAIADSNGVTVAAYLRAMIVDVLAEGGPKIGGSDAAPNLGNYALDIP